MATTTGSPPASRPWRRRSAGALLRYRRTLYRPARISDPAARHIPLVERITPEIDAMAGGAASELSRGGMRTKIEAGKIAAAGGTHMLIADGRAKNPLPRDRRRRAAPGS
jgi:glutamate 5-kinase